MNAPQPRESPAFRRGEEVNAKLVTADDVDTLRLLLSKEADRRRGYYGGSDLARTIAEARQIITATSWTGPLDDAPEWALMAACPHPWVDCYGVCDGCGADMCFVDAEQVPAHAR